MPTGGRQNGTQTFFDSSGSVLYTRMRDRINAKCECGCARLYSIGTPKPSKMGNVIKLNILGMCLRNMALARIVFLVRPTGTKHRGKSPETRETAVLVT